MLYLFLFGIVAKFPCNEVWLDGSENDYLLRFGRDRTCSCSPLLVRDQSINALHMEIVSLERQAFNLSHLWQSTAPQSTVGEDANKEMNNTFVLC